MKKQNGYVLDTTYPRFFYKEMQPLWLKTVVNLLGFQSPQIANSFSYLELACATGTNLLVCAIHYPHAHFVGVDFNQDHIQQAQQTAKLLGLKNVEFIHADFATFLTQNTQKFDFIVNHGTFSWVSPQQQAYILEIVARSLNDLGLFYLHYMCYPGSTDLLAMQKLLNLVNQHTQGSSLDNIALGKKLILDLNAAGAFIDHPKTQQMLNALTQSHAYLAHEFLTDDWQPLYSVDVHKRVFETTQMSYLGSAQPCHNLDSISIPSNMQHIIQNTPQVALKEYLKDIARDAKQRVDIFQKTPKSLIQQDYAHMLKQVYFQLLPHAPRRGAIEFKTDIGEIKASQAMISPLLEALSQHTMTFSQLLDLEIFKNKPLFLMESIFLLMNAGYLHPVSDLADLVDQNQVQQFNMYMQQEAMRLVIWPEGATAIV